MKQCYGNLELLSTMCASETRTCTNWVLSGSYSNASCSQSYRTCSLPWWWSIAHGAMLQLMLLQVCLTEVVVVLKLELVMTELLVIVTLLNLVVYKLLLIVLEQYGELLITNSVTAYAAANPVYPTTCTSQTELY